jgi:cytochrome c-type biogenesis protein CcmH/NrfF
LWLWWAPWVLLLGGLLLWLGVVLRSRKARVSLGGKQDQIEKLLKDNT